MSEIAKKSEEQRSAEADVESFRRELGPFVVAAEATRMPMLFTDAREPRHPIIFANDSFLTLTGFSREDVIGQDFNYLLAPGAEPTMAQVERGLTESGNGSLELQCRRRDGALFWAAASISPVRDGAGEVVQHFVSLTDLTGHIREEEHLRFLLAELNHRTQNTLATVQAIAAQTLRGVTEPGVLEAFQGRILALSKAHNLLGRENWAAVNLRDVIDQILQPFGLHDRCRDRFVVEGEDVRLAPKAAVALAMVFHELATNAAKHGALSNGAGKVHIDWRIEPVAGAGGMRLCWRESGGPPVTTPERSGFGSRLIEDGLAQQLNGEVRLDYDPAGLVCTILMPDPSPATVVAR